MRVETLKNSMLQSSLKMCKLNFSKFFSFFLSFQHKKNLSKYFRRKQVEVETLEQSIKQRSEQQKKGGSELDATCQICLKTRFADGIGHVCHYCSIRCCARCGGKVTLRSSKVNKILLLENL